MKLKRSKSEELLDWRKSCGVISVDLGTESKLQRWLRENG